MAFEIIKLTYLLTYLLFYANPAPNIHVNTLTDLITYLQTEGDTLRKQRPRFKTLHGQTTITREKITQPVVVPFPATSRAPLASYSRRDSRACGRLHAGGLRPAALADNVSRAAWLARRNAALMIDAYM